MLSADETVWVVLLAGGRGTRFWPRSRAHRPKQCLDLYGGDTLLGHTLARAARVAPPERTLVITGPAMADAVRAACPGIEVLVEPSGRNTAPPVAWAAIEVAAREGTALAVLPADHRVADATTWAAEVERAVRVSRRRNALVLLGCRPDHPATGYGYVVPGERLDDGAHAVARFTEKPDRAGAEALIAAGALWNSGMFVFTTDAIEAAFRAHLPATWEALATRPVAEAWPLTEATSLDYGVLERARSLAVVPCEFGWSDLGTWTALEALLPDSPLGAASVAAGVALDGGGHVVHAPGKLVATLGVSDLVIVDTGDVLLVCRKEDAQRIGALVRELPDAYR